jgi:hypothetical protein
MERTKTRLTTILLGSFGATAALTGSAAAAPSVSPHDDQLRAAVVHWFNNGGDARITALRADFGAIGKAAGSVDMPGMKAGCSTLVVDVDKAQHYAALPDAEAQRYWSAALDRYAKGAATCVKGASNVDGDLLKQANDEIMQGGAELTKATARVQDILN